VRQTFAAAEDCVVRRQERKKAVEDAERLKAKTKELAQEQAAEYKQKVVVVV
jgi:hypothetical protein